MAKISKKEIEAALSAWNNYNNSEPVAKDRSDAMRAALEAADRVRGGAPISLADAEKAFLDRVWPRLQNGCYRAHNLIPIEIQRLDFNEFVRDGLRAVFEAAASQPSVKVKPLEWVASDDWEYRWTADLYAIEDQGKNWPTDRYWLYYNGQRLGKFGTLDVALFVAQADYERRILSALISSKPEQHPDDEAVDRFAAAMKAKLKWEREERDRYGWNDPEVCSEEYLAKLLIEHLAKGNEGNFEDIANLCMMLHQRGAHPRVLADALTADKPETVDSVLLDALRKIASTDLSEYADMTTAEIFGALSRMHETARVAVETAERILGEG